MLGFNSCTILFVNNHIEKETLCAYHKFKELKFFSNVYSHNYSGGSVHYHLNKLQYQQWFVYWALRNAGNIRNVHL